MNDTIQLWHVPLAVPDTIVNRYWAYLSEDEKVRGDRFRFAKDRRRFAVARGVLRCLLSKQLGLTPNDIQFCYGEYGKPTLARSSDSAECNVHFNLSHSEELALCVLGGDRTVGVDIEYLKSIKRLDGMMERCLTAQEVAEVTQHSKRSECSETAQLKAFLQRWTCKEAYLKAIGLGLTQSMQSVEVRLNPPQFTAVPQACALGWQLHVVEVPNNYVGALVVAGEPKVMTYHWKHPCEGEEEEKAAPIPLRSQT